MTLVVSLCVSFALAYLALLAALLVARPKGNLLGEAMRLLPDLLRLLRRLAADANLPRAARVWLWLLFGYLAVPFDLVPDFVAGDRLRRRRQLTRLRECFGSR